MSFQVGSPRFVILGARTHNTPKWDSHHKFIENCPQGGPRSTPNRDNTALEGGVRRPRHEGGGGLLT